MRIYYVRSILFVRRNGHYVIADHLREYGSWTQEDQVLYDRPNMDEDEGYFRYDEQSKDWHFWQKRVGRDDELYHSVGSGSIGSSVEQSTCDSSSGEEEESSYGEERETSNVGHRALTVDEGGSGIDDWLRSMVETFEDPARFDIIQADEASSALTLPPRTSNRVTTVTNSPQQPSGRNGETAIVDLAETDTGQERGGQQENVRTRPTANEQGLRGAREQEPALQVNPMSELVDGQALTKGKALMLWNDPFFGAEQIDDVWDI
ncbi:hypothetical protein F4678DRAFT_478777 [Xylaria arbuscula]|nr:hypothetical protein F4678DRAFT_478777 [Xylaria arbuscula]